MKFAIFDGSSLVGVADYLDDAVECARRMSGLGGSLAPTGELLSYVGTLTGFRVMKFSEDSA